MPLVVCLDVHQIILDDKIATNTLSWGIFGVSDFQLLIWGFPFFISEVLRGPRFLIGIFTEFWFQRRSFKLDTFFKKFGQLLSLFFAQNIFLLQNVDQIFIFTELRCLRMILIIQELLAYYLHHLSIESRIEFSQCFVEIFPEQIRISFKRRLAVT